MDDDETYTREALAMGSNTQPPVLFRGYYSQWKSRFLCFINVHDLGEEMIQSIREGPAVFMIEIPAAPENDPPIAAVRRQKDPSEYTPVEKNRVKADILAFSYLIRGLTDDIFAYVDSHETAKSMWDEIEKVHGTSMRARIKETGTRMGAWIKETNILTSFENFKAREGELLESTYNRYCKLLNELRHNHIPKSNLESNIKFLNNLRPEWKRFTTNIVQNKDLTNLSIHVVYEHLNQNQDEVLEIAQAQKPAEKAGRRLKNSSRSLKQERIISVSSSDIEGSSSETEVDIQALTNTLALLSKALHQNTFRKPSSNKLRYSSSSKGKEKVEERKYEEKKPKYTRSKEKKDNFMKPELKITEEVVKCFNCGKPGHYARECRKPVEKNFKYYTNKSKLANKREAGIALTAEENYWLDLTSDDEDDEDLALMCLTAIAINDEDGDCSEEEDKESHCSESISKLMVTTSEISIESDPAEIPKLSLPVIKKKPFKKVEKRR